MRNECRWYWKAGRVRVTTIFAIDEDGRLQFSGVTGPSQLCLLYNTRLAYELGHIWTSNSGSEQDIFGHSRSLYLYLET
jgi:hypothetical protein